MMYKVELGDGALFGNIAFWSEHYCSLLLGYSLSNSRFMKQIWQIGH
jgi:hypothetical protein